MSEIRPGDRVILRGVVTRITESEHVRRGECAPGTCGEAVVRTGNGRPAIVPLAALEPDPETEPA